MSHACHRFRNATKPSRFAHFWQRAQSLAPATQNDIWTSKSAPNPSVFCTLTSKCLRATTACTFSTSQLRKVLRTWGALAFSLANVLRATTTCTFSTAQLLKAFRSWGALYILIWKCASHHMACNFSSLIWPAGSAPAALASLLFNPPEPQIIGKTQWIATFLPFRAPGSSFFWDFLFLLLFPDSSHLCFSSVHIVGSLTSKLHLIMSPEVRGVIQKGARYHEISRCTACISIHLEFARLLQCPQLSHPFSALQHLATICFRLWYQRLSTKSLLKDCRQARLRYSPRRKPRVRTDPYQKSCRSGFHLHG